MEIMGLLNSYKDRKVLVTGHTGFKGAWLSIWLHQLGADVIGISLDPRTEKDVFVLSGIGNLIRDYRADIRNLDLIMDIVKKEQPEVLFHLAAQPIVIDSYNDPVYTFETNVMGTVNMLEAFRKSDSLRTGIFITTDKCYENREQDYAYKETDPMGGHDPYSSSKGAAELIISSYRRSYFSVGDKKIASVRAGNVIGGGDWSPYRLMVDIVRSIESGQPVIVRNPSATRPWQHVLEPLGGYLLLGERMIRGDSFDEAWNFGPEDKNTISVKELIELIINEFGKGKWIDISENKKFHEANLLALDITKARHKLGWHPVLNIDQTIKYTVDWYKEYQTKKVLDLCVRQINDYLNKWIYNQEN